MTTYDFEAAAGRMYNPQPTPGRAPVVAPNAFEVAAEKLYGGSSSNAPAQGPGPAPVDARAEKLYGQDPGEGVVPGGEGYGPHGLDYLLEGQEREARSIGDEGALQELATARNDLGRFLEANQVGASAARNIAGLAAEYQRNPVTDLDALERRVDSAIETLRGEYGSRTATVLEASDKIVEDLCRRVPAARHLVKVGLATDLQFRRWTISLARKRGLL